MNKAFATETAEDRVKQKTETLVFTAFLLDCQKFMECSNVQAFSRHNDWTSKSQSTRRLITHESFCEASTVCSWWQLNSKTPNVPSLSPCKNSMVSKKIISITTNSNDQRSHGVFFCFSSAIFKLTSAKFQTFAYNSRAVWSSFMKFWQQFKINKLHVCTRFQSKRSRDLGFRTQKPRQNFGVKSGFIQKWLKYAKNISHGYMS